MCDKKGYPTQREAGEHRAWIKLNASNTIPKRSYFCPDCGLWHNTSAKRKLGFSQYKRISNENLRYAGE